MTSDRDFGLWAATAEPAPDTPPLPGPVQADVAVVGAGFTGLSAALHLAGRGASVVVLDRHAPGWGASGRNGGQVLPGFKTYPGPLRDAYGPERGEAMAALGSGAADALWDLVGRHGIQCHATRSGWVHAGHDASKAQALQWRVQQWQDRGAPVRTLDPAELASMLGTHAYPLGWVDERGGGVQPLSLARGLARAALGLGVAVHGQTPATRLRPHGSGWQVHTPRGTVTARRVLVATNGYTSRLVPGLAASVVPLQSAQVATEPLDGPRAGVLPTLATVCDTRQSMLYFRRSPDGRLVMGGKGGILFGTGEGAYARLRRLSEQAWPALRGVQWTHAWAGTLAVTTDHLPHVHEPAPGLVASLGCNGRGVAYSVAMGAPLADWLLGGPAHAVPMLVGPVRPMPFAPLRRVGAAAVAGWYGVRDWLG